MARGGSRRGAGRKPKSIDELKRSGTFRPSRHANRGVPGPASTRAIRRHGSSITQPTNSAAGRGISSATSLATGWRATASFPGNGRVSRPVLAQEARADLGRC